MGATDVNELAVGCRISNFNIQIPANGMATVSFGVLGKDMSSGATATFVSPTAETTTAVLAGASGKLYADGVAVATVTGMNIGVSDLIATSPSVHC